MKKIPLIFVLLIFTFHVFGQAITNLGNNKYLLAVNSQYFDYAEATNIGNQHDNMWCWAACCQMILNFHGLKVTQEQIVYRCFGSLENAPGGEDQMFVALSGTAPNIWGTYSGISTDNITMGDNIGEVIFNQLKANRPLAVGLTNQGSNIGHENVITGITFYQDYDQNGNQAGVTFISVILRDPYPGVGRVVMPWDTFFDRAFSLNTVYTY